MAKAHPLYWELACPVCRAVEWQRVYRPTHGRTVRETIDKFVMQAIQANVRVRVRQIRYVARDVGAEICHDHEPEFAACLLRIEDKD